MPAKLPTFLGTAGIFCKCLEKPRKAQKQYKIFSILPNISNVSELVQTSSD